MKPPFEFTFTRSEIDEALDRLEGKASDDEIVTGTWAAGQHTNEATASGSFTDDAGNTETDTDSDAANYFGANAEIDVEKYVSIDGGTTWVDADAVPGPYLNSGTAPQFKFVVTNLDTAFALSNVTLTDSDFNIDTVNGDKTVEIGALAANDDIAGGADEYELIYTGASWAAGQHTNTATASGDFTDGNGNKDTQSDSDDANYFGANSAIDVEKFISIDNGVTWLDEDAVTGPMLLESGFDPKFKFVVTNTGNVALSNVQLSDSDFDLNGAAAGTSITIGTLAVGGTYETIITAPWQADQHTNTANEHVARSQRPRAAGVEAHPHCR